MSGEASANCGRSRHAPADQLATGVSAWNTSTASQGQHCQAVLPEAGGWFWQRFCVSGLWRTQRGEASLFARCRRRTLPAGSALCQPAVGAPAADGGGRAIPQRLPERGQGITNTYTYACTSVSRCRHKPVPNASVFSTVKLQLVLRQAAGTLITTHARGD